VLGAFVPVTVFEELVVFANALEKPVLGAAVVVVRTPEAVVALPLSDGLPVAELSAAEIVELTTPLSNALLAPLDTQSVTVTVAVALTTVSVVVTVTTPEGQGGHVPEASVQKKPSAQIPRRQHPIPASLTHSKEGSSSLPPSADTSAKNLRSPRKRSGTYQLALRRSL